MTDTTTIKERSFSIERPWQPIHGWGPSTVWSYTDRAGHVHRYDDRYEPLTGTCYPTLRLRTEHVPCTDPDCGCDGYTRDWYECYLCNEVIRPSVVPTTHYLYMPPRYYVDGIQVTEQDYGRQLDEFLATWRAERDTAG
jgi:hypothetical protein